MPSINSNSFAVAYFASDFMQLAIFLFISLLGLCIVGLYALYGGHHNNHTTPIVSEVRSGHGRVIAGRWASAAVVLYTDMQSKTWPSTIDMLIPWTTLAR